MKKNMCSRCCHIIKPDEETMKIISKSSESVYLLCDKYKNDKYIKELLEKSNWKIL